MRKYTYKFNKSSDIVLDRLNEDIKQRKFIGRADSDGLQLRCVCDGYSQPSTYQLTAKITENTDEGCCTLLGEYRNAPLAVGCSLNHQEEILLGD